MKLAVKVLIINLAVFSLYLVDRVLKYIFSTHGGEYFILGNWLKLQLAYNPGIAFGLPLNYLLILCLYCFILFFLISHLVSCYLHKKLLKILSLSLILVGAFSNLLDRLYVGRVIDYIDVKYYSIFNLADALIVTGVVILIWLVFKERDQV